MVLVAVRWWRRQYMTPPLLIDNPLLAIKFLFIWTCCYSLLPIPSQHRRILVVETKLEWPSGFLLRLKAGTGMSCLESGGRCAGVCSGGGRQLRMLLLLAAALRLCTRRRPTATVTMRLLTPLNFTDGKAHTNRPLITVGNKEKGVKWGCGSVMLRGP